MTQANSKSPNFVIFMVLILGWLVLHSYLMAPKPKDAQPATEKTVAAEKKSESPDKEKPTAPKPDVPSTAAATASKPAEPAKEPAQKVQLQPGQVVPAVKPIDNWITLGSADEADPYRMLVTLSDRGASVVRIELNNPRYRQLMDDNGFLADRSGFFGPIGKA